MPWVKEDIFTVLNIWVELSMFHLKKKKIKSSVLSSEVFRHTVVHSVILQT